MSQSEYELIHSAQVQRDKKKLDVLAPSNTTQFLIRDHNRQTPSSIATPIPTPTHQQSKINFSIKIFLFFFLKIHLRQQHKINLHCLTIKCLK